MPGPIESIDVSHEMVTLIGAGDLEGVDLPDNCAALVIQLGQSASVTVHLDQNRVAWEEAPSAAPRIGLVVMRSALGRLFDWSVEAADGQSYFLTEELANVANQLVGCQRGEGAGTTYRLAKSIELLCDLIAALQSGALVPTRGGASLKHHDGRRLVAARRIIEEQWSEKLTLGDIARRCGLNRTKLARGFKEIYDCSVSQAIAEKRLAEARRQLLSTDLPVGVIGYRSGYSNNASFTRAFGRRFGISPSDLRASRMN
jgi:AraC family transcriptional regulator, transcriptional activator of the genes for pyochelin and ferripyochelin receptors